MAQVHDRLSEVDEKLKSGFRRNFDATFTSIKPRASDMIAAGLAGHPRLRRDLHDVVTSSLPSDYPFMLRFCHSLTGGRFSRVKDIAAAVHLLQTSTFLIDDVFDGSHMRYGALALWRRRGRRQAVAAGEVLQSIAMKEIALSLTRRHLPNGLAVLTCLNDAMIQVYVGQSRDMVQSGDTSVRRQDYTLVARLTTSGLLAGVAEAGILLGDGGPSVVRRVRRFATLYGLALQASDDLTDLCCSSAETGKTFGADLKAKRLRLPILEGLSRTHGADKRALLSFIKMECEPSQSSVDEIVSVLKRAGALAAVKKRVNRLVRQAVMAAGELGTGLASDMLAALALSLLDDVEVLDD